MICFCCLLFFFKQKTAYEMRISDWSSDVCSSDLGAESPLNNAQAEQTANLYICIRLYIRALWRVVLSLQFRTGLSSADGSAWKRPSIGLSRIYSPPSANARRGSLPFMRPAVISRSVTRKSTALSIRSEEHTSELQSLMRISYAVFCLKKKTITTNISPYRHHHQIQNTH